MFHWVNWAGLTKWQNRMCHQVRHTKEDLPLSWDLPGV